MYGVSELTVPEELLLLCASPRTGELDVPRYFTRALAAGALTELQLRGAITVEGNRITEVRPMTVGEPIVDEILAALVRDVQLGRPGARQTRLVGLPTDYEGVPGPAPAGGWARRVAHARVAMRTAAASVQEPRDFQRWLQVLPHLRDLDQRYAQALERRGLLISNRRRTLGMPRTVWTTTAPAHTEQIAARIDREIRPHAHGRTPAPPSPRTVHLVALAHAAGLTGRRYPEREHHATHRYIEDLTAAHHLAQAAHSLIKHDSALPSGG
ncbi:hypothetical protein DPM19_05520 [Actinomadura craniellae]|uniref:GPP34 family phosphoprotein n=1 Tax=Actinomadura craniellae TaxID=2231787 RepID=A0A365HBE9_9ACTN|nr:GPP34 family phosphoprotein [Actinomadura craniellae]RAY16342.1 hypothetical protein DPM19_05520 [Actinomadura craniellae]